MSEITRWEGGGAVERAQTRAVTRLVDWAQEADAAYTLAQKLTTTTFCPEQFRGKPADAAAAMLAGGELGLSPMSAMNAFDVIQGRAAPRAITLRALAQAQGHDIVLLESTATRCRMKAKRRGSAEWQTITWTIDRAKDLNLTGKSNWKQQPQAMLMARATSEVARLVAADALLGVAGGYSAEEVADGAGPDVAYDEAPAPAPAKRTLRRAPAPAPAPVEDEPAEEAEVAEVVEDEGPADEAEPDDDEPGVTAAQLKNIGRLMTKAEITERAHALEYVSTVVGRKVGSRKELTVTEGSTLIEALMRDVGETPNEPDENFPASA